MERPTKKVSFDKISEHIAHGIITKMIICFVLQICTHFVAESMHNKYFYYSTAQTYNMFVKRVPYERQKHYIAIPFNQILTIDLLYRYIENNFLPILYDYQGIADDDLEDNDPSPRGVGVIVGVPRIRQLRVTSLQNCLHEITINYLEDFQCHPDYTHSLEDKSSYKNTHHQADAKSLWTMFHHYSGGGYSINFHLNQTADIKLLNRLKKTDWIDRGTRLVVLEFSVFYDGNQMFQTVKLIFEVMPTGVLVPSSLIRSIPLQCFLYMDDFNLVVGIIYYIIIFQYSYHDAYEISRLGFKKYIKLFHNYADMFFLLSSYFVFAYNVWHTVEVNAIYKAYNQDKKAYINMDSLISGWEIYVSAMGVLTFTGWLKIIRYISFHRTVKRLESTVRHSRINILGFFVVFLVTMYAFAQFGTILFSSRLEEYSSNLASVITLMRFLMSDVDYTRMHSIQPYLAPIYFIAVVIVIYGLSLNLFVAIYLHTYSGVKASLIIHDNEVLRLLGKGLKTYFVFWRKRDRTEIKVFSLTEILTDSQMPNMPPKLVPPNEESVLQLRESLARVNERSFQIEALLEKFVEVIEKISKIQNSRKQKRIKNQKNK